MKTFNPEIKKYYEEHHSFFKNFESVLKNNSSISDIITQLKTQYSFKHKYIKPVDQPGPGCYLFSFDTKKIKNDIIILNEKKSFSINSIRLHYKDQYKEAIANEKSTTVIFKNLRIRDFKGIFTCSYEIDFEENIPRVQCINHSRNEVFLQQRLSSSIENMYISNKMNNQYINENKQVSNLFTLDVQIVQDFIFGRENNLKELYEIYCLHYDHSNFLYQMVDPASNKEHSLLKKIKNSIIKT